MKAPSRTLFGSIKKRIAHAQELGIPKENIPRYVLEAYRNIYPGSPELRKQHQDMILNVVKGLLEHPDCSWSAMVDIASQPRGRL